MFFIQPCNYSNIQPKLFGIYFFDSRFIPLIAGFIRGRVEVFHNRDTKGTEKLFENIFLWGTINY
ncbi:MAG: hypothetical protein COZ80_01550 [Ignavibacteria bacterium CG_4_8_14_3_um_filter_37_9]|nr:MAG: hypothetical protein AUJ54_10055 [Ignavibacteria bacterium CG1_02_37_35]PIP77086.1 MAG: hypothetical protein COW85_10730 [Ignavibacteria bacterium CG22_combo_CG10-13_8_21_14_all_37_15]PIS45293.1 MAG: hypothetical protein COT22_06030 [Ignavibacteria bacterium CG08_land_8_20_14_0_20_37_9]PIX00173.1 MAG: hypothetical protein COZ80_01550 [Ignavibacteria bacterium CG_4_8_14_3_um_filter_37_9]PIX93837.1 MAG: hypothetical protein COZ25_08645 [Ignavibacteria bacterium CG_4_10_14_3_um_filter_37_1